jgi:hypothetical protein
MIFKAEDLVPPEFAEPYYAPVISDTTVRFSSQIYPKWTRYPSYCLTQQMLLLQATGVPLVTVYATDPDGGAITYTLDESPCK